MTPNIHRILARCIEEGLIAGYNRAHKHDPHPTSETIGDCQFTEIMNELDEYFIFEGVGE